MACWVEPARYDPATYFNDPAHFRIDYQKRTSVTAADVLRVAKKYLTYQRIVLSAVPKGALDQASHPEQSTPAESSFAPKGGN